MNDEPDGIPSFDPLAKPPRPKIKYKRRRRPALVRARIVDPAQLRDEFPGLTVWNCCDTCGPRCVITEAGSGVCAHPCKGALQAADQARPAVLAKFNRAKATIQKQRIDEKVRTGVM